MQRFVLPLVLSALTFAAPGTSAAADGKALYSTTCVSCHGASGKGAFPGVPDLGPRMTKTDAQLINSIVNGFQSKGSPMAMPAKGGNPSLTAADAAAIVTYLRAKLNPSSPPKAAAATPSKPEVAAVSSPPEKLSSQPKSTSAVLPTHAIALRTPRPAKRSSPPSVTASPRPTPVVAASSVEPATLSPMQKKPSDTQSAPMLTAQNPPPADLPPTVDVPLQTSAPPADMAAFSRGAKAWGEHCASCHSMRDPKDFNDAQWKIITTHMRLRAGLDGADVRDINVFLTGSN